MPPFWISRWPPRSWAMQTLHDPDLTLGLVIRMSNIFDKTCPPHAYSHTHACMHVHAHPSQPLTGVYALCTTHYAGQVERHRQSRGSRTHSQFLGQESPAPNTHSSPPTPRNTHCVHAWLAYVRTRTPAPTALHSSLTAQQAGITYPKRGAIRVETIHARLIQQDTVATCG